MRIGKGILCIITALFLMLALFALKKESEGPLTISALVTT